MLTGFIGMQPMTIAAKAKRSVHAKTRCFPHQSAHLPAHLAAYRESTLLADRVGREGERRLACCISATLLHTPYLGLESTGESAHHMYNRNSRLHHYTTSLGEKHALVKLRR
jgi:hypothetical protein